MGKRRHSAKTGDKKLYARRKQPSKVILDLVENSRSSLAPDHDVVSERPLDEHILTKHQVLDLGVSDESSKGEYVNDDESMEDVGGNPAVRGSGSYDYDSDEGGNRGESNDPRRWGKKKSSYYDADTGDLEIGQDEQDAFMEEAAAREVQTSRFGEMDQGDFVLPDVDVENSALPETLKFQICKDIVKLPTKQRRNYLRLQHPELIPLSSHFSKVLTRLLDSTKVILGAALENKETARSIGASEQGQLFLITKAMIEQNISLNFAMYLLVKAVSVEIGHDVQDINAHPVMRQLNIASTLMDEFNEKVAEKSDQVKEQMNSLAQAASIMPELSSSKGTEREPSLVRQGRNDEKSGFSPEDLQKSSRSTGGIDSFRVQRVTLDDARFGMRQHEIHRVNKYQDRPTTNFSDVGDATDNHANSRYLAATINAIDQRSAATSTNGGEIPKDDEPFFDDEIESSAGVKLMVDAFDVTRDSYGSCNAGDKTNEFLKDDEHSPKCDFYHQMAEKAARQKRIREEMHKVAPKFPELEAAVEGERAISTTIMKNRGLIAHKAKINRNPRVKKRQQYRKALIRRKGAVRVMRTDESHKYSGEETGIKSTITRSRKLAP